MTKQEWGEKYWDIVEVRNDNYSSYGWRGGNRREKAYGEAIEFIKNCPFDELKQAREDAKDEFDSDWNRFCR